MMLARVTLAAKKENVHFNLLHFPSLVLACPHRDYQLVI